MPACDIITISCRRDLNWLYYAIRLLLKYWQHDSRIIVRLDEDCQPIVQEWNLGPRVVYIYLTDPWPDGYTYQMYLKMISDEVSDAELFLLSDSDLMLLEPASLDTLMVDGKPIIEYGDWGPVAERMWRGSTARVMGMDLPWDYMVGQPFLFWRDIFEATRNHIAKTTGKSFYDTVYSGVPFNAANFLNHPVTFSEHEALNLYAATFQRDRYFVRKNTERPPAWPWKLYWSHGGLTPEIKAELDSKL
jgi:uncharacterized protein DUF6492